ncbi:MAG TPA: RHS repeat-associated core domain-containing protein [Rhodanobacter sp.]|nr:RHS repeat-associated core domain-containing protein [Rhodanobacter sp.]
MKKMARWLILTSLWLCTAVAQAGTHHYYYTDPQGTVLAKADASGTIIATYDYAPYGTAVASMNPAPNGPGYTGHVNDPDTGLVYMQARYYDPVVGRFLSVDPVTPASGNTHNFNRYDYAANNPVVNIDPDGRDDCPGQSRAQCVRSDSGAARDLRSTPQQDTAAVENRSKVETSEKPEKVLALIGTTNVTAQPVSGQIIQTTAKDGVNLDNLPPGTTAVEHSHIDGKTQSVSSDGFSSPGDAQPLGHGIINYAVSERRVAKYEVVGGRIQVTALKGSFTSREAHALEQSVNAQQPAINSLRPTE